MPVSWYALRSKTRKEEVVNKQVRDQEIEVYYPRLRVNPINPRSRHYKPYFPGYLFVRIDLELLGKSAFQWLPHTLGLVSFGGEPAVVPDNLVQAVRLRVEEISLAGGEVFDGLRQGDPVTISSGPFEGYEAIFDSRLPGNERVHVLLQLLDSRQVPIELGVGSIRQKTRSDKRANLP